MGGGVITDSSQNQAKVLKVVLIEPFAWFRIPTLGGGVSDTPIARFACGAQG